MKFVLLFITLSGNYDVHGQIPVAENNSVNKKRSVYSNVQPIKIDTVITAKKPSMRFFPNPAKNKITIVIRDFEAGNVQVQLLDNSGNKLRDDKRLVLNGNENIVFMFSHKPGLYFITVRQKGTILKSRLIIQ